MTEHVDRPGRRVDLPQGAAAGRRRRAGRRGPPAHPVAQPARRPDRDGRGRAARRGHRPAGRGGRGGRAAGVRCAGIGISGMAEAGVLIDGDGRVDAADRRPGSTRAAPPRSARWSRRSVDEFPRRTGLPASPLATFAKLLHARGNGVSLAGRQWLNLPEFVAHALGGGRFGEPSLRSRTGLIDQDTGRSWAEPLRGSTCRPSSCRRRGPPARPGATASRRVPPVLRRGGAHRGRARPPGRVGRRRLRGPDRPVQLDRHRRGAGPGARRPRWTDRPGPGWPAHGINVGAHLLPGRGVLLAGIKTGLLLRRLLQLVGVTDAAGRARLDERVMALAERAGGARAARHRRRQQRRGAGGAGRRRRAQPRAVLRRRPRALHPDPGRACWAGWTPRSGRPTRTVLSGGWSSMRSVRRARAGVLPGLDISDRPEGTAYGAGLIAAFACLGPAPGQRSDHLRPRVLHAADPRPRKELTG